MTRGKRTEKIVALIQESLKSFPNVQILPNYRIKNKSGRKREIDVLLITDINGFEIKIAIECKDYKSSIPVEKIEAFNSKCARIEGVSKKVFVSTNGYQADSIEAAKDFDIELFDLEDISTDEILKWLPVKQLKPNIKIQLPLNLIIDKDEVPEIPTDSKGNLIIHFKNGSKPNALITCIWNHIVVIQQDEIQAIMRLEFMKGKCRNNSNLSSIIPCKLNTPGAFVYDKDGSKVKLIAVEVKLVTWFDIIAPTISEAKKYYNSKGIKARTLSIDNGKNGKAEIIQTKDGIDFFHTNKDGLSEKLVVLGEYNPKTGKYHPKK